MGQQPTAGAATRIRVSVQQPGCEIDAQTFFPPAIPTGNPGVQARPGEPAVVSILADRASEYTLRIVPTAASAAACAGATVVVDFGIDPTDLLVPVGSLPGPGGFDEPPLPPPLPPPGEPAPVAPPPAKARGVASARLLRTARSGRSMTLRLAKSSGARAARTYRARITRGGRTVASGTLRSRTLRLVASSKTKKAARPKGTYRLRAQRGVRGTPAIDPQTIVVR